MSRIRTVKPEFWTSEQIISCSVNARLLFIGLWNFCDDAGIHPLSYVRLKAEVFPADCFTVEDIKIWIAELIKNDLLREFSVDNEFYWMVTKWFKHQRIDRPNYRYPRPQSEVKTIVDNSSNDGQLVGSDSSSNQRAFDDNSTSIHRTIVEHSTTEGKGRERNGRDILSSFQEDIVSEPDNLPSQNKSSKLNCPHEQIIALYHEILPMCPDVRIWNKTRSSYLRQRWAENPKHQNLDWWEKYFEHVKQSGFLVGKTVGRDGKPPFIADLEWLVRPNNFCKVVEGRYHGASV